ncbi:MAG: J domain-containing protein, partial [Candidatus Limnocylindrales bacterium]
MAIPRPVDPYRVLGVRADATLTEIKGAHRRLAKRFHPDAGGHDAERFLAIQDAYQVLADPLRRKEWDLHHAPGPVRADQRARGAAAAGRTGSEGSAGAAGSRGRGQGTAHGRGSAGAGGSGRPDGRAGGGAGSGRARSSQEAGSGRAPSSQDAGSTSAGDPYADRYTWSARGVPWWESDAPPGSGRRQPGRKRPRTDRGPETPPGPPADFEVFNRSSGAAWSSAARAHFRRSTSDMATGAAEPYATRWTTPEGGKAPVRSASGSGGAAARPAPGPTAAQRPG